MAEWAENKDYLGTAGLCPNRVEREKQKRMESNQHCGFPMNRYDTIQVENAIYIYRVLHKYRLATYSSFSSPIQEQPYSFKFGARASGFSRCDISSCSINLERTFLQIGFRAPLGIEKLTWIALMAFTYHRTTWWATHTGLGLLE